MSLQSALLFVEKVAADGALREAVEALGPDADLSDLVAMGGQIDLDFSVDELREAFVRDWAMRRAHFTGIVED